MLNLNIHCNLNRLRSVTMSQVSPSLFHTFNLENYENKEKFSIGCFDDVRAHSYQRPEFKGLKDELVQNRRLFIADRYKFL